MPEQTRRAVLGAAGAALAGLAGCGTQGGPDDPSCWTEADWSREVVRDEVVRRGAGASYARGVILDEGDRLRVAVDHRNGSLPAVALTAPNGSERVLGERIRTFDRNVTIPEDGQYNVEFRNYGANGTGAWRERLVVWRRNLTRVCE